MQAQTKIRKEKKDVHITKLFCREAVLTVLWLFLAARQLAKYPGGKKQSFLINQLLFSLNTKQVRACTHKENSNISYLLFGGFFHGTDLKLRCITNNKYYY